MKKTLSVGAMIIAVAMVGCGKKTATSPKSSSVTSRPTATSTTQHTTMKPVIPAANKSEMAKPGQAQPSARQSKETLPSAASRPAAKPPMKPEVKPVTVPETKPAVKPELKPEVTPAPAATTPTTPETK